ncbi:uncharacterized protein LOC135837734 [Planococcus citri]|uniref:uncharacterized protein LOC135837734 n=1 Tax=Planococcus citri TaxID=170843 RepID=UPI0031F85537
MNYYDYDDDEPYPPDEASAIAEIEMLEGPMKQKEPAMLSNKLRFLLEQLEAVGKPPDHDDEKWHEMGRSAKWKIITSSNNLHPWLNTFIQSIQPFQSIDEVKHEDVYQIVRELYDICSKILDDVLLKKPAVNLEKLKEEKYKNVLDCLEKLHGEMMCTSPSPMKMLERLLLLRDANTEKWGSDLIWSNLISSCSLQEKGWIVWTNHGTRHWKFAIPCSDHQSGDKVYLAL